jgi:hypothetical protein
MKTLKTVVFVVVMLSLATPAFAGVDWLRQMAVNTNKDFETAKLNFRAAYTAGYTSWEDYGRATGFSIGDVEARIKLRRARLNVLATTADTNVDAGTRGLVKLLINDLDRINLSLLALIQDDRGYAGYIRTPDPELVGPVSEWQEGIRQSMRELNRSMRMVRGIRAGYGAPSTGPEVAVQ